MVDANGVRVIVNGEQGNAVLAVTHMGVRAAEELGYAAEAAFRRGMRMNLLPAEVRGVGYVLGFSDGSERRTRFDELQPEHIEPHLASVIGAAYEVNRRKVARIKLYPIL
jgi:hypothetical protein